MSIHIYIYTCIFIYMYVVCTCIIVHIVIEWTNILDSARAIPRKQCQPCLAGCQSAGFAACLSLTFLQWARGIYGVQGKTHRVVPGIYSCRAASMPRDLSWKRERQKLTTWGHFLGKAWEADARDLPSSEDREMQVQSVDRITCMSSRKM